MADIKDVIAEFEAKLKPVPAADIQMAKGESPAEEAVAVAEPPSGEAACINKDFKRLVEALPGGYVGNNIKDLVMEFLGMTPECEV